MSEKSPAVLVEKRDNGAALIKLNRPDVHNAFDDKLIKQLIKTIQTIDKDDTIRIVVLSAEGKSFSAGADLNWMRKMADYNWSENYQDSLALATLMQSLKQMCKPTVAWVQGAAYGGGVGLVACCDFAIASNKAKFCLSEVKLGLIPAVISPYVIDAIGERNAHRYFVTAEVFDAEQAEKIGLVQQVVDESEFNAFCESLLNASLANGPNAIMAAKKLIQTVSKERLSEDLIRETAQRISDIRASQEGKEGVSAFLEKRAPNWQGQKDA